jgi:hypothetical protein
MANALGRRPQGPPQRKGAQRGGELPDPRVPSVVERVGLRQAARRM